MGKADKMDDVDDDDADPITASYPVYLNPALPLGRRLLVLQQPNRTDDTPRPAPTELRLKSHSGMVEVDLPLDTTAAYDREKGLRWGRTLQTSMAAKNGGSHGLAGGFGFGAVQQRGKKKGQGQGQGQGEGDDDEYMDWNEAVRQEKVLKTQTLGGQYPDTDEVQYMVGVFQGSPFSFFFLFFTYTCTPLPLSLPPEKKKKKRNQAKSCKSYILLTNINSFPFLAK